MDRSWPLVVLPNSTLLNLVAISESSALMLSTDDDAATLINFQQVRVLTCNFRS